MVFLISVVSLYKKTFFSLSNITNITKNITLYVLYHFQNRSVPTPLRYENHAEKYLFHWKQKAYPIWKLEWGDSDPVWWKQYKSLFFIFTDNHKEI